MRDLATGHDAVPGLTRDLDLNPAVPGQARDSFAQTRNRLEDYFDRTASETWARLTSDAPVSRIRQTVREGRDAMRAEMLGRLPRQLGDRLVLDAGCGVGQASAEMAGRGAGVMAVDISASLLEVAQDRVPAELANRITFRAGDMLDPGLGRFDHVFAMDSLIHYAPADIVDTLAQLANRTRHSIVFTVAPRTTLLAAMHNVGKLFPRGDRSPAIQPIAERDLASRVAAEPRLGGWTLHKGARIARGFYISQCMELRR